MKRIWVGAMGIVVVVIGFVVWMNVTEGHFQKACDCCVSNLTYTTRIMCKPCVATCVQGDFGFFEKVLLQVSTLDFKP